jgi:hypothetical protein
VRKHPHVRCMCRNTPASGHNTTFHEVNENTGQHLTIWAICTAQTSAAALLICCVVGVAGLQGDCKCGQAHQKR